MSDQGWSRTLVLGGIRSGKSAYAESLVESAGQVRYVATSPAPEDDPEWRDRIEAHRRRRPATWTTQEVAEHPSRLAEVISTAEPGETLLVDDLGGWVSVLLDPARQPADHTVAIDELAAAVRDCPARLVLVAPEVGLSLVPTTPLGRAFADTLGATNQAVAAACDEVVLVVAGQPVRLKPAGPTSPDAAAGAASSTAGATASTAGAAVTPLPSPEVVRPTVAPRPAPAAERTGTAEPPPSAATVVFEPGMRLPMPDEKAARAARDRLAGLDVPGAGVGALEELVAFAAGTQASPVPAPWRAVRVLLLHGDHDGGVAAGSPPADAARWAAQARAGEGALARLAAEAGAELQVVDAPPAAAIEHGPALDEAAVQTALRYGWQLAEEAATDGAEALVLGACGSGSDAAAVAVIAAVTGTEPVKLLSRVPAPGGRIDDNAWIARCAAIRDALHRSRRARSEAEELLAELGGGDIAIATGLLLGATAHRIPVLLDGPVGVAAGLLSRDYAGQARHWCLLPDHGGHPGVRLGADVLGLDAVLDLRLGLGEGATALAALPLLRAALSAASALPAHPALAAEAAASSGV